MSPNQETNIDRETEKLNDSSDYAINPFKKIQVVLHVFAFIEEVAYNRVKVIYDTR